VVRDGGLVTSPSRAVGNVAYRGPRPSARVARSSSRLRGHSAAHGWACLLLGRLVMQHIETTSLQTIESFDLIAVTGGYDWSHALQAGNAAAAPGREAGQTLGAGFDAAYKVVRGQDSTIGGTVGGPVGAAVGWAGGFAADSYQQLVHGKK
jgi:hypothetical protein